MSDSHQPAVEIIMRVRSEIYDHILQGDAVPDRDRKILQKHFILAEEMGNLVLMSRTLNVLGILEQFAGQSQAAIEAYQRGAEICAKIPDTSYMALMKNNVGEVYRLMGNVERALEHYLGADELLGAYRPETIRARSLVDNNLGLAYLERQDYEKAEQHFTAFIDAVADETWEHIDVLIEARRGLAEVYLAKSDFERAWWNVRTSMRLAEERQHHLLLTEIYLTCAHIAAADPNSAVSESDYIARSRAEMEKLTAQVNVARNVMAEARYQHRHQQYERASELAQEALTLFNQLGLQEEVHLAETLLHASAG